MLVDIHIRRSDGSAGRLFDTIDRQPKLRRDGPWVEFDSEWFHVLTGVRAMILVTEERLKKIKRFRPIPARRVAE